MTREEMAGELRQLLSELSDVHPSRYALSEAIFAFSSPCACGGGKLIADHLEMVYSPHDERHWLEVGMLLERERAGQDVRVRIVEVT